MLRSNTCLVPSTLAMSRVTVRTIMEMAGTQCLLCNLAKSSAVE